MEPVNPTAQEILETLGRSEVFSGVPPATQAALAGQMTAHAVTAGERLIEQGTAGDALWVLDEGMLEVRHRVGDASRRIGLLARGAVFGEGAILSGEERGADVLALRDSRLLRLQQPAFVELLGKQPEALLGLVRLLLKHRQMTGALLDPPTLVLAVVALDAPDSSRRLMTLLETAAAEANIDWSRVDESSGAARDPAEVFSPGEHPPQLLLVDAAGADSWTHAALRNADRVVLATDSGNTPDPHPFESEICRTITSDLSPIVGLVGEPSDDLLAWTAPRPATHVRSVPDLARAAELLDEVRQAHPDLAWLRRSELFRDLDPAVLGSIAARFRWRALEKNEVLFEAGAPADALFLVVAGRLAVHGAAASGSPVVPLNSGAMVGEMGFIQEDARTATVTAARDSVVAELTREDYEAVQRLEPTIGRRLVDLVMKRLVPSRADRPASVGLVIAAVPLDDTPRVTAAVRDFEHALRTLGTTTTLDRPRVEQSLGPGGADLVRGAPTEHALISLMDRLEADCAHLLLISDTEATDWTRRTVRQADIVLLFGDADAAPSRRAAEHALWPAGGQTPANAAVMLVLAHAPGTRQGSGTAQWLDQRKLDRWAHVVNGEREGTDRLARRVLGRGVGLALSGGGSRGAAHLGVVRALSERRVSLDHIAGTSAGAAIAGLAALGLPFDESKAHVQALLGSVRGHLATIGPPVVSAMSGRHVQRLLEPWFGEMFIEDLLVPLSIAASDVSRARVTSIERGRVWEAVRASTSIPGLWPPVVRDGLLHVDGGVLNNLPADLLDMDCRHGTIIASDVGSIDEDPSPHFADPEHHVSGWRVLWERRRPQSRRRRSKLAATVVQSMLVSSQMHLESTIREHVDVLIRPNLDGVGMFEIRRPDRIDWAAARGYEATLEALADFPGPP